ncbi:MAG TPA: Obg family GTPase CgtA [Acidimicrobiia bacterium]|nr:Obg family GTPase CgtA [Acidimicrobiia bacterium]
MPSPVWSTGPSGRHRCVVASSCTVRWEPTFTIFREEDAWRVSGRSAERAVAFADLTVLEAADMAAKRLTRLGVDDALQKAGAVEGDEVGIGDLAFELTIDHSEE